jgi:hypothetical protein
MVLQRDGIIRASVVDGGAERDLVAAQPVRVTAGFVIPPMNFHFSR